MEFRILGPLEARNESGTLALGGIKPRLVLSTLLLHPNEPVQPDRLALAVWGDDAPASAVKTVQVYVSRLRKAFDDPEVLVTTPAGYRLRVLPGELDAERFERLVDEGRHALEVGRAEHAAAVLHEALALWRGPPLAELAYEPSAQGEIARLHDQRLAALEARIEADLAAGRHAAVVGELRQLVAAHPTREHFVSQLIVALYRCGQQADALAAFQAARSVLIAELGVEPGPELRELHQSVLTHDARLHRPSTPADPTPDRAAALPVSSTRLFGREAALAGVAMLLREITTRLVTLVGPGGVGKTRLAIESAHRLADDFTDGARFIALASVTEPRDLASAIVRALGAPVRQGETPTAALMRYLGDRHLLLVLDNLEHLLAEAPLLSELLAGCRDLTVLVTSREPTRLEAERLYPVRPLELPEAEGAPSTSELESYSGVAMFVDRARARDPDFALDQNNAPHVRDICRRLDGLPLALELAAARLGLLSAADLSARLDRALPALSRGPRDAPERHRTLRATIDWSFDLLTVSERDAFTRLAVFASGSSPAVAERVTGASLDTLESLVAKHLLVRRGERLQMLQTVREYASEQLARDAAADAVHERLATWCLGLLREATPHLVRVDRIPWLAALEAELPNALGALSWTLSHQRHRLTLELVSELAAYWWRTGASEFGLPWIDAALEQADEQSVARARAHLARARLVGPRHGQRFSTDIHASLKLFRACHDDAGIAACLGHLADLQAWNGDPATAMRISDEAMQFAQRADDEEVAARVLKQRASAARGYDETANRSHAAVAQLRAVGNLYDIGDLCAWTGCLAIVERRYEDSLAWLEEGLEAGRQLGHPMLVFLMRGNQGLARLFLGELDAAADAFAAALIVCRDAGAENLVDETLLGMAAVAARRGEFPRAARLSGAAARHATTPLASHELAIMSRLNDELTAPRQSFGTENWDRGSAEGASLTVSEAIDLALQRGRFAPSGPDTADSPIQHPS